MLETEVESSPEAIGKFLKESKLEIELIGLESGNLTHYRRAVKNLLKKRFSQ